MTDEIMEQLLREGESSSLDYKRDQYPFAGATDDQKGELLKDILAFANGWRRAEAYILVGVDEVSAGRSTVFGVDNHIPESHLQQFVNTKTNRPVTFSYRGYPFEGKQVGVFTIPQQDRPIFLAKDYAKLGKHIVYYRQGTTTAVASPDDVARMGTPLEIKKLIEGRQEKVSESVRVSLILDIRYGFVADIYNDGEIEVYIKEVALCYRAGEIGLVSIPLLVSIPMLLADGKGSEVHFAPGRKNHDLPCRKEVKFILARFPIASLEGAAIGSPDDVWLAVISFGGEVHRVLGEEVQTVLRKVLELWRMAEEEEKPSNLTVIFFNRVGESRDEVGRIQVAVSKRYRSNVLDVQFVDGGTGWNVGYEMGQQLLQELAAGQLSGWIGKYGWRIDDE